jgi:cytochrome c oxidase subunit II
VDVVDALSKSSGVPVNFEASMIAAIAPSGPAAKEISSAWWTLLVLGSAVYVLVLALLAAALLRRRTAGDSFAPETRPHTPGARGHWWVILGGVVLPAVVLVAALTASVAAMRRIPQTAPSGSLVIEVVGYQWWWSVRYPAEQVTVANEIHIPVGEPVALELTSADVIHSFWVPELAGKLDALPDGTTTLVIEADEPGEYRGLCAEFCGLQHAKMGIVVIAQPANEFATWIADQRRPAASPSTADSQRGEALFLQSGCAECHTVRDTVAAGVVGPDLTHVASRRTLLAATMLNTREDLARLIRDPDMVKDGIGMPATRLGDEELAALLAYLESLE